MNSVSPGATMKRPSNGAAPSTASSKKLKLRAATALSHDNPDPAFPPQLYLAQASLVSPVMPYFDSPGSDQPASANGSAEMSSFTPPSSAQPDHQSRDPITSSDPMMPDSDMELMYELGDDMGLRRRLPPPPSNTSSSSSAATRAPNPSGAYNAMSATAQFIPAGQNHNSPCRWLSREEEDMFNTMMASTPDVPNTRRF